MGFHDIHVYRVNVSTCYMYTYIFLAELTKFGLCPKAETMKCITVSVLWKLLKIVIHNIE